MKIAAGLGSVDDLPLFAEAGADEVFVGYIPGWWQQTYGMFSPLNRREVLYYNVQIGSESEMEILHAMSEHYGIDVSIALNALYFLPKQFPDLLRYIRECLKLGFSSFIVADPALLIFLAKDPACEDVIDKIRISVSGETGEMNSDFCSLLAKLKIRRMIFHRKMTIGEMKQCRNPEITEYEAFALNEKCHFHGGYCNSLHCDELTYSCRLPYRLGEVVENTNEERRNVQMRFSQEKDDDPAYLVGESGCALCKLWDLEQAGITHLKIVGRGNYTDCMLEDLKAMKKALKILRDSQSREKYIEKMKQKLFPNGCSGECYYLDY